MSDSVSNRDRGWREVTLGECAVINDATYSPKEAWPLINYLDTGSITDNQISQIQQLAPGKDKIPSRARRKVKPGDIVYSTVRPNQRHFGLLKNVPEHFLASTGFAVLRGIEGIADTGFLYWFLAQDHIIDYLHSIGENSTSAYPSIKPSDLEQLTLRLPPLPEQRAIAHVLGTLDDKIELNRRMNETLEQMARALFKSWFVGLRPGTRQAGWPLASRRVAARSAGGDVGAVPGPAGGIEVGRCAGGVAHQAARQNGNISERSRSTKVSRQRRWPYATCDKDRPIASGPNVGRRFRKRGHTRPMHRA